MLRFLNAHPNSDHQSSRREWLRIGGLAGLNWALPGLIPQRASADSSNNSTAPGFGKAKSVIVVFASGGQSQIDMWDPKPDAPKEIRGAFSSINTAIPGVRFSEHMPQIAKVADKLCIVRSMAHEDLDHGSAFYLSMPWRGVAPRTSEFRFRTDSHSPERAGRSSAHHRSRSVWRISRTRL
jgi:hypothetical protein